MNSTDITDFAWQPQPRAAAWVDTQLQSFVDSDAFVANLRQRLLNETGTRLVDWIDHLALATDETELSGLGYQRHRSAWRHPLGLFPAVRTDASGFNKLAIKVESVSDFLAANRIEATIEGRAGSPWRGAQVSRTDSTECWVIERHGSDGFEPVEVGDAQIAAALKHNESFLHRRRDFDSSEVDDGFDYAEQLIAAAIEQLGVDWACDLFFAAERRFWQSRNSAAGVQKARQDRLGLGWANHDHHTYRSSRNCFARLIHSLEQMGFECRERFYGGRQAGWGAQVLEQPRAGIVIFADVDLTPDEVTGDFAHEGLSERDELGTVGLWCKLHGEAFLGAGMHHLECRFDFNAARQRLAEAGIKTMAPFTDLPYLKQAFTEGEVWPVDDRRIDAALNDGSITAEQAQQFRERGSMGSHLEILQRDEGYKGFNQTGISEIIRETDPRRRSLLQVSRSQSEIETDATSGACGCSRRT